jgi:MinD-like ATPase involved in chromosome partitioning or flagellar assembly
VTNSDHHTPAGSGEREPAAADHQPAAPPAAPAADGKPAVEGEPPASGGQLAGNGQLPAQGGGLRAAGDAVATPGPHDASEHAPPLHVPPSFLRAATAPAGSAAPYPPATQQGPGAHSYPLPAQPRYAGQPYYGDAPEGAAPRGHPGSPGRYAPGGAPAAPPSYDQDDYGYGSAYADPVQVNEGWDYPQAAPYADPAYDVPAYPEPLPQPEPLPGPGPEAYQGVPPDPGYAYGHEGGYGEAAGGHAAAHHPAGESLAPLPPRRSEQRHRENADSLTVESLLPTKKVPPPAGWRRAVYRASGGLIRPGESQAQMHRRELVARARTPVAGGHHRVAVMSLKGGVGKTTTAVGLGAMLASLRGDRVIAVDANPDRGTLSDKVRLETAATVRDLLNERAQIQRYADVRAFTSQAPSRLEVLASDRDPTVSVAFSEDDYYDVAHVLEHYYSICLTDCGTGLLHSAMAGVLRMADQIVLVSSPSVDGARSASATLDWLDAHEFGDLVRNAVVVLAIIRPRGKSTIDLDRLEQHFAGRCRAVVRIPYDGHLEEGAEVDIEAINPETADAYLQLAATVGDGFAWPRRVRAAAS